MNNILKEEVQLLKCPPTLTIDNLTSLLKNLVNQFPDNSKEQILVLYSILTATSGLLTKVTGSYDRKTMYPNLFFLAFAPPASGKGHMMIARDILHLVQARFKKESDKAQQEYKLQTKGNGKQYVPRPPYQVINIPANCSSSKLMQHLADNDPHTPSIIIESEIDSMTLTIGSEFGNYSDIMRKAFHNEPISQSRKSNDEYITIDCPKLAIVLSGTPGQVYKLINNKEDGLLSRFMIMNMDSTQEWRSVAPCPTCINLTDYYQRQSLEYFKFWEAVSTDDISVELTDLQWATLEEFRTKNNQEVLSYYDEYATSIVKRHGNILFKLCMVLSAFRKYETNNTGTTVICTDEDFKVALFLASQSLAASLEVFEALPEPKAHMNQKQKNIENFYKFLPDEFERSEALTKATTLKINPRTMDRYLKDMVQSVRLGHPKNGKYKKIKPLSNCQLSNN